MRKARCGSRSALMSFTALRSAPNPLVCDSRKGVRRRPSRTGKVFCGSTGSGPAHWRGAATGRGDAGPVPASVTRTAAAMSARSSSFSSRVAAGSQPSTCPGRRAPTIAPVTSGNDSVHATATAGGITPCRSATGRSAPARARLCDSARPVKSGSPARQSPGSRPGCPLGGERPGEQARGHRAVDDHPGLVLAGPQQHIIGRVPVDQVERRLDGIYVPDLTGGL